MIIKRGSVVSHTMAKEWGIGKVTEIDDRRAVIQFNDGMIRKISSSHFFKLEGADPALYLPCGTEAVVVATAKAAGKSRKVKGAA